MENSSRASFKFPNICIIGAGFSGLTAAIQLKRKLNLDSFDIFDENSDVGGTWFVNKYPGCACDVPSHLYSWSFEPSPDWSATCASSNEIQGYMRKVAEKYELYSKIRFNTTVKETIWDDDLKKWKVYIQENGKASGEQLIYDIVISGVGLLRAPKIPDEYKEFKGVIVHTAKWDSKIDLKNKIVGVVGCGASAIQIIPKIAPEVKELHLFQRNPQFIIERPQKTYSTLEKFFYKWVPFALFFSRIFYFWAFELFHSSFFKDSKSNKKFLDGSLEFMNKQIKDKEIKEKVRPNFVIGSKRILFHENYYPTLHLPNVFFNKGNIERVAKNGVIFESKLVELDVLILATGFEPQKFLHPLKIVDKNGIDLNEHWIEAKPSAYLGLITHSAPNHFIVLGPNTHLGHNSLIVIIECQVDFIISAIKEMMTKGFNVIKPKESIEMKYMKNLEKDMEKMVWKNGNCNSWYNNSRDDVTVLYPRSSITYRKETRKINLNDFEFE